MQNENELSTILVEEGLITEEELERALEMKKSVGGELVDILTKFEFADQEEVMKVVANQQGLEMVDLSSMVLPEALINEIPRETVEQHEVIPISVDGDLLTVAIHDPFEFESIEEIQLATDRRIEMVLATREAILKAINELYYQDGGLMEMGTGIGTGNDLSSLVDEELEDMLLSVNRDQLVKLLVGLLLKNSVITADQLKDQIQSLQ